MKVSKFKWIYKRFSFSFYLFLRVAQWVNFSPSEAYNTL
ncbi:unnamed protein product [Larinioides sclopetarius]|uniref:Uncharacterized protein n=1 Tax=Larinioides sclopetarius TaxID=280406 RepID=A0AAV1ZI19_9ARAC